jgi:hypothetical protein
VTEGDPPAVRRLRGGCVCGAVTYRVADAFLYAMNCHCSACRRATGSAFKPMGGIPRDQLEVETGADRLMTYGEPDGHDARCGVCGALLYSVVREGAYVHVALGSLTDTPTLRPTHHIFVGSKAEWEEITDGLPESEKFPLA